jgi:hypothetical protein
MEILDDGSILFGGSFSDFMGVERYSMVKLNQGTVSTQERDGLEGKMKIYPNPARDRITVHLTKPLGGNIEALQILDLSGRTVASYAWGNAIFDVSQIAMGMYLLTAIGSDGAAFAVERLVID